MSTYRSEVFSFSLLARSDAFSQSASSFAMIASICFFMFSLSQGLRRPTRRLPQSAENGDCVAVESHHAISQCGDTCLCSLLMSATAHSKAQSVLTRLYDALLLRHDFAWRSKQRSREERGSRRASLFR